MSGFSTLNDFLPQFADGGARPNRYWVQLTFPAGVAGNAEKIMFTTKGSAIPSSNLSHVDVPFFGRMLKVAGDKTFDDWNITVLLDNDWVGRTPFESWHSNILRFTNNVAILMPPTDYYGTAEVTPLGRDGSELETYTIEGIFPLNVSELTIGYDMNEQIYEQQVTFAVNNWVNTKAAF